MKIFFLLSAAMMLCVMLSAQTQQGYVKTKGRMVNDKLVPDQSLKAATVAIKGRMTVLVNTDDGAFSFPIPDAQFRIKLLANLCAIIEADKKCKAIEEATVRTMRKVLG